VKVRMEAAGLCHSDHHVVSGDIPMAAFPMLGGHEGAGIVVEVGDGVEGLSVGDHVAVSFIPSCGSCPSCRAGETNLCDLGMGLMAGTAVSDGTFRVQTKGQNRRRAQPRFDPVTTSSSWAWAAWAQQLYSVP
jgi:S-(hydroxymethyl)glutathione dehydrogenase/alcohol dehydrogenase